ncbi:hypothetical protein GW17_00008459 [Ensete ventricosum]|nr:hypothetical protein GW17_00008459 [Ensete ventricosum]
MRSASVPAERALLVQAPRVEGKRPRVRLERSAARVVELRSRGNVSARVGRWFLQEGQVGSRRNPSNDQVSLDVDFAIPLLRRGAPVPEVFTVPVAYHAIVLRRNLHGPRSEVRGVLPATGEHWLCPPYLCQVDRLTLPCLCQVGPNHVMSVTSLVQLSEGTGTW